MAKRLTLTILLLLLVSMPPASGQYVTVIAACTRDVTKFCQAARPQRNFLAECIETHFQVFKEQCRTALMQTAAVREACNADIAQQTFRCARSVLQGRDPPRGRAESGILLKPHRFAAGGVIEHMRVADPMNDMAKGLSDDDLRKFAEAITKLPAPRPPDGPVDTARIERARALVAQNRCNICHTATFAGQDNVPNIAD